MAQRAFYYFWCFRDMKGLLDTFLHCVPGAQSMVADFSIHEVKVSGKDRNKTAVRPYSRPIDFTHRALLPVSIPS